MATFFVLAGLFFVLLVLYILLKMFVNKQNSAPAPQGDGLSAEQHNWAATVGRLFGENYALDIREVYVKCGMPHDIAYSKNSELIEQNIPFEKGSEGDNVIKTYALAISKRYGLINFPLQEIAADTYGLNLNKGEHIYHRINNVGLFQEKTTQMNFVYSGVRWQSGFLRAGSMNVIGNEITRFVQLDAGRLIFTNKRLIYVGAQKNVTKDIPLTNILYTTIYKDGVLVHQANKKPLLFTFANNKDFEVYQIDDGMFEFMTVLARLQAGTEKQSLVKETNTSNGEKASEVLQLLKEKGCDPLLHDVILFLRDNGEFGNSTIQRNFSVGYNRACHIVEQLVSLNLVKDKENGKYELLPFTEEELSEILKGAAPIG